MGRHAKHAIALEDGRSVGATPKVRGAFFRVQFAHATEAGKYVEATTGVAVPKGWHKQKSPPPDWFAEATRVVRDHYAPTLPGVRRADWDTVIAELERMARAIPMRGPTLVTYKTAIGNLRAVLPEVKAPADLTPALAHRFFTLYSTTPFKRGKSSDAKEYPRSPQTVWNALANLSIVWSYFAKLGFVVDNPWHEDKLKRPRLPERKPTIPTEEAIARFFQWLDARYPGWEVIRLFVEVKMLAGCRLRDLCQIESGQLQGDVLTIRPDQDKTHRERTIPLPPELAARLRAVKGPLYLWERYTEDTKVYRPGRRRAAVFTPDLIYHAVKSIFREYGRKVPELKIKSHDLRKRAITLTTLATGGNTDQAAAAIGIDPQTAREYYIESKKAFDTGELMKRMAGVLLPAPPVAVPR